jgi:hypothetical protein
VCVRGVSSTRSVCPSVCLSLSLYLVWNSPANTRLEVAERFCVQHERTVALRCSSALCVRVCVCVCVCVCVQRIAYCVSAGAHQVVKLRRPSPLARSLSFSLPFCLSLSLSLPLYPCMPFFVCLSVCLSACPAHPPVVSLSARVCQIPSRTDIRNCRARRPIACPSGEQGGEAPRRSSL